MRADLAVAGAAMREVVDTTPLIAEYRSVLPSSYLDLSRRSLGLPCRNSSCRYSLAGALGPVARSPLTLASDEWVVVAHGIGNSPVTLKLPS